MEKLSEKNRTQPEIVLSQKEKILETVAVAFCFLLLLAFFMKVMFF